MDTTKSLNTKQNGAASLSCTDSAGLTCIKGNRKFADPLRSQCVCFTLETEARHFVLLRMSCLTGQSRRETRKRRCLGSLTRRFPSTTSSLSTACRDYVTGDTISPDGIYSMNMKWTKSLTEHAQQARQKFTLQTSDLN